MPKKNDLQAAEIGKRILKTRKELGLTQEELADRSGLSQSFLTCVERGEKGLGFSSIVKISHALGTSTDYLLTGATSKKESNYILQLFELMDETQREHTVEIVKRTLLIGGKSPPEP